MNTTHTTQLIDWNDSRDLHVQDFLIEPWFLSDVDGQILSAITKLNQLPTDDILDFNWSPQLHNDHRTE